MTLVFQRRLGFPSTVKTGRKAGVLRGESEHPGVPWQSEPKTTMPRIDELVMAQDAGVTAVTVRLPHLLP